MQLTPTTEKFILHWGEMGSRWGVNRTVAQIHALLYLSPKPLNAEAISETLGVARSNVSTSLKELQSWELVKSVHVLGDRRDYFETHKDVWDIFFAIAEQRKRREFDPTLSVLRECVIDGDADPGIDKETLMRIKNTLEFLERLMNWYEQIKSLSPKTLGKIMKLGAKIQTLLGK